MNDPLPDTVAALCEEVGVARPRPDASGSYQVEVGEITLRFFRIQGGRTVLTGLIGSLDAIAEARRQSVAALLMDCLALSGARFRKLAAQEVLSVEPDSRELVLWRRFEGGLSSVSEGLQAAESLLNETEYWRSWTGAN